MKRSEFEIIKWIQNKTGVFNPKLVRGMGDDAAVINVAGSREMLLTTDCLVEDVHFTWKTFTAFEVGHKALAVNVSDLAAMGANPKYVLVSLGLSTNFEDEKLNEFYEGFLALAQKYQIDLIGGNLTKSKNFFASITLMGEPIFDQIFYRDTACDGDVICVTGPLGWASLGHHLLQKNPADQSIYSKKQKCPNPRMDVAQFLSRQKGIHAVIDLSDGLSGDLNHVLQASQKGAQLFENQLPCANDFKGQCEELGFDTLDLILHGGEDYELLVTLDEPLATTIMAQAKTDGLDLISIGKITPPENGFKLIKNDGNIVEMKPSGFVHF